ncbi:Alkylglycerol monooxygenase [Chelonia mydas]|uniref:Alkylglycerol monooxygenase n=1 Tax=Chelonia mydas TaxID=8469 RepID=M7AUE3_CHEMY|nr:Alkylglycerol monooxygenase [Chelonia mydas]
MLLEFVVSWVWKHQAPGRINDSITSVSAGVLSRLPECLWTTDGVGHHELSHEPGVALTDFAHSQYRLVVGVPCAQGSHNQGVDLDLVALGSLLLYVPLRTHSCTPVERLHQIRWRTRKSKEDMFREVL